MVMVQIRNVPEELHARLKVKAAERRMSLSDYLLSVVERAATTLTSDEVTERLEALGPPLVDGPSGAELVAEGRRERDAELERGLGLPGA